MLSALSLGSEGSHNLGAHSHDLGAQPMDLKVSPAAEDTSEAKAPLLDSKLSSDGFGPRDD